MKEEIMFKYAQIRSSYARKRFGTLTNEERALFDYETFCLELIKEYENLQSQLKAKEEAVEKFEKYLNNCVNELENNYGTSSIQNAINTGIVDITKVILSKFNEILSKGENK